MQLPNHRPGKLDMLSQHAMHKQAIPAHSHPIRGQGGQTTIPACSSLDNLSQHAISQSEARGFRHAIPVCTENQSLIRKVRHVIPAYKSDMLFQHTLQNLTCIKEAAKAQNSGQADTAKKPYN